MGFSEFETMTLFALLEANCCSPQWGNGFLFKLSKTTAQTETQEVQYKHETHLSCFKKIYSYLWAEF